ncbi:triosephosphate isomerase [Salinibacterium amurskyense]|uniref:Triosephosphate isomerase n=1 Tax=Salinibacterium amurskyense TaxID=205941 RepID=A0A2M9DA61_9MICO|nr:triose-phosphate isomerase [Salinibacterium amurskyense]PJJ82373.1 triosephosphate isomerase [Salinibacterium amurskyense]RLQ82130.1 triose-phosphate isomerase [Salinibacterium amurskyense]GHD77202.1 triosephosphate isomerase [Salinibacterium amurskyense]
MAKVKRVPLIAGNWKMNLDHLQSIAFVQKLAWTLKDANHDFGVDGAEVAVFPPFTDLRSVQTLVAADKLDVRFGGQDVSEHESGAYTGEISGAFLSALDCRYVLVGHSERRTMHGETDEQLARKVAAALKHGLVPVLCVGETADDLEAHGPSAVPVAQLKAGLAGITGSPEIVVAYEPVWAIGSGKAATPEQAEQVAARLRETLAEVLGDDVAAATRILYGGSVKSSNIASLMREPNIDGALVGGASLDVAEFASISRFSKHVGT